jgi:hypothetical protein
MVTPSGTLSLSLCCCREKSQDPYEGVPGEPEMLLDDPGRDGEEPAQETGKEVSDVVNTHFTLLFFWVSSWKAYLSHQ